MAVQDDSVLNPGSGGDTARMIQRVTSGPKAQVVVLDLGGPNTNPESLATGALPIKGSLLSTGGVFSATDSGTTGTTGSGNSGSVSGTATTGSVFALQLTGNEGTVNASVTSGVGYFEVSDNSTTGLDGNWWALYMHLGNTPIGGETVDISNLWSGAGRFTGNPRGAKWVRARNISGTGTITLTAGAGAFATVLDGRVGISSLFNKVTLSSATSGTISAANANLTSGSATGGSAVAITGLGDASQLSITVQTAFVGTLQVQISGDNANWESNTSATGITKTVSGLQSATITGPGTYEFNTGGCPNARVTASAYTSGAPTISISASNGVTLVSMDQALPAGTNQIGGFNLSQYGATAVVNGGVAGVFSVGGNVAHSAARTANPITVGGQVVAASIDQTLASGDVAYLAMTSGGQLIEKQYASAENDWFYAAASGGITNTTAVAIKAAGAAGVRNYLTSISITNGSGTVATEVVILDGATVIARSYVGTSLLLNSAVNMTFPSPLRGTAATAMSVQCVTTGAAVYVNAQGYQGF